MLAASVALVLSRGGNAKQPGPVRRASFHSGQAPAFSTSRAVLGVEVVLGLDDGSFENLLHVVIDLHQFASCVHTARWRFSRLGAQEMLKLATHIGGIGEAGGLLERATRLEKSSR